MDPFAAPTSLFLMLCLAIGLSPTFRARKASFLCLGLSCAVGLLASADNYSHENLGSLGARLALAPGDILGLLFYAALFSAAALFVGALPFALAGRVLRWAFLMGARILAPSLHARLRSRYPALDRRSWLRPRHVELGTHLSDPPLRTHPSSARPPAQAADAPTSPKESP